MSNILLINDNVQDYQQIIDACNENTHPITYNQKTDTYDSIFEKYQNLVNDPSKNIQAINHLAIAAHGNNNPEFIFLEKEDKMLISQYLKSEESEKLIQLREKIKILNEKKQNIINAISIRDASNAEIQQINVELENLHEEMRKVNESKNIEIQEINIELENLQQEMINVFEKNTDFVKVREKIKTLNDKLQTIKKKQKNIDGLNVEIDQINIELENLYKETKKICKENTEIIKLREKEKILLEKKLTIISKQQNKDISSIKIEQINIELENKKIKEKIKTLNEKRYNIIKLEHKTEYVEMEQIISELTNLNSELNKEQQILNNLESWSNFNDFIKKFNIQTSLDLLGCALLQSVDWKYTLNKLETEEFLNLNIRASDDNTGNLKVGGDWVLESDNVNIKELYFLSETIEKWDNILEEQAIILNASSIIYRTNNSTRRKFILCAGRWDIELQGASGAGNANAGRGANLSGTFFFPRNTTLYAIVGERGLDGGGIYGGGGGGGTFLYTIEDGSACPIFIAGGGGGWGGWEGTPASYSSYGQLTQEGGGADVYWLDLRWTSKTYMFINSERGQGGSESKFVNNAGYGGHGGGGWYSAGTVMHDPPAQDGREMRKVAVNVSLTHPGSGGYGGGGSSGNATSSPSTSGGGGGGGGYSGGVGGYENSGGGGGSYVNTSYGYIYKQTLVSGIASEDYHGYVKFTLKNAINQRDEEVVQESSFTVPSQNIDFVTLYDKIIADYTENTKIELVGFRVNNVNTFKLENTIIENNVPPSGEISIKDHFKDQIFTDELYPFKSHIFTPCGSVGRKGPTLDMMQKYYKNDGDWTQNPEYLKMDNQGYQKWTVPKDGRYRIIANGAHGGRTMHRSGKSVGFRKYNCGLGAIVMAEYELKKGDKYWILVGQKGGDIDMDYLDPGDKEQAANSSTGGGGGGTFVVKAVSVSSHIQNALPKHALLVAGGGGGGGFWGSTSPNDTNGGIDHGGSGKTHNAIDMYDEIFDVNESVFHKYKITAGGCSGQWLQSTGGGGFMSEGHRSDYSSYKCEPSVMTTAPIYNFTTFISKRNNSNFLDVGKAFRYGGWGAKCVGGRRNENRTPYSAHTAFYGNNDTDGDGSFGGFGGGGAGMGGNGYSAGTGGGGGGMYGGDVGKSNQDISLYYNPGNISNNSYIDNRYVDSNFFPKKNANIYGGGGGGSWINTNTDDYKYIENSYYRSVRSYHENADGSVIITLLDEDSNLNLYSFNDIYPFIFTNCEASGALGPTINQMITEYMNTYPEWNNNLRISNLINEGYLSNDKGIQIWTVPRTGYYKITAWGGDGGEMNPHHPPLLSYGGRGAKCEVYKKLYKNEKIEILVGQGAGPRVNDSYNSAAGGGGTYVARILVEQQQCPHKHFDSIKEKIVIAGGGGGGHTDVGISWYTWYQDLSQQHTTNWPAGGMDGQDATATDKNGNAFISPYDMNGTFKTGPWDEWGWSELQDTVNDGSFEYIPSGYKHSIYGYASGGGGWSITGFGSRHRGGNAFLNTDDHHNPNFAQSHSWYSGWPIYNKNFQVLDRPRGSGGILYQANDGGANEAAGTQYEGGFGGGGGAIHYYYGAGGGGGDDWWDEEHNIGPKPTSARRPAYNQLPGTTGVNDRQIISFAGKSYLPEHFKSTWFDYNASSKYYVSIHGRVEIIWHGYTPHPDIIN